MYNFRKLFFLSLIMLVSCSTTMTLEEQLQKYVDEAPAEIGVGVIIPRSDTIVINDGKYQMNSVLKLFQSLPTVKQLSANRIMWDAVVDIPCGSLAEDTWSPMLKESYGDTLRTTYGKLLEYALGESDNNACDWLFDNVVSTDSVDAYWRKEGYTDFQIKWDEAQMHEDPTRSNDNWTSPLVAAKAVQRIFDYSMASSDFNTSQISGILMHCQTGLNRIPAPLTGTDALVAHKTGTGFADEKGNPMGVNDVAYVILPDGKSYALAVFVQSTQKDMAETEEMIADISEIVYKYVSQDQSR